VRGFTQETTTAILTTIDNTECMSENYKIPGNIASITDHVESSLSIHGEISTCLFADLSRTEELCMDLISNQTPNFLLLLHYMQVCLRSSHSLVLSALECPTPSQYSPAETDPPPSSSWMELIGLAYFSYHFFPTESNYQLPCHYHLQLLCHAPLQAIHVLESLTLCAL